MVGIRELELFHHYRTEVAVHIADEFNRTLWAHNFLQAAHHCPAIWHACNMYAAVHQIEQMRTCPDPSQADRLTKLHALALQQYSFSLKGTIELARQETLSSDQKATVLAANVIFLLFAINRGELAESLQHLRNGLALIQQWRIWEYGRVATSTTPIVAPLLPSESLLLFYVQIDALAQESQPASSAWRWESALEFLSRRPICSLTEACLELEMIWLGLKFSFKRMPLAPTTEELQSIAKHRLAMSRYFYSWRLMFHEYRSSTRAVSAIDSGLLIILETRQLLVDVLLRVDVSRFETCWDVFEAEFGRAVCLLELLLGPDADLNRRTVQSFSFTPSITTSLQFLTTYCRSPTLRRRAISLLKEQRLREFTECSKTDKTYFTQTAELIMALEEKEWSILKAEKSTCPCVSGEFICNMHRVAEFRIQHTGTFTGELILRTVDDVVHNRPVQTIPMTVIDMHRNV